VSGVGGFTCRWSSGSLFLGMQLLRQDPVDCYRRQGAGFAGRDRHAVGLDTFPGGVPNVIVWGTSMSELKR